MQKALLCFAILAVTAQAQWLNYRAAGTPTTPDGKVNLAAPAPRMPDGKPDLSGVWHAQNTAAQTGLTASVEAGGQVRLAGQPGGPGYSGNVLRDVKPGENIETPLEVKVRTARLADGTRPDPTLFCLPWGMPVNNLVAEVVKFVQAPRELIAIYEVDNSYRQIYLDGRPLPKDPNPSWMGYSTGHWEGETLVVESEGFNDRTWLDMSGHSHGEMLHLTERYHRRDFGHMDVEMIFTDPEFYSKPFSIKFTHALVPDSDILESYCNENNKDLQHIQGAHEIPAH